MRTELSLLAGPVEILQLRTLDPSNPHKNSLEDGRTLRDYNITEGYAHMLFLHSLNRRGGGPGPSA